MNSLPADIFSGVMSFSDLRTYCNVCLVSRRTYHMTNLDSIWYEKCRTEGIAMCPSRTLYTSWKDLYKTYGRQGVVPMELVPLSSAFEGGVAPLSPSTISTAQCVIFVGTGEDSNTLALRLASSWMGVAPLSVPTTFAGSDGLHVVNKFKRLKGSSSSSSSACYVGVLPSTAIETSWDTVLSLASEIVLVEQEEQQEDWIPSFDRFLRSQPPSIPALFATQRNTKDITVVTVTNRMVPSSGIQLYDFLQRVRHTLHPAVTQEDHEAFESLPPSGLESFLVNSTNMIESMWVPHDKIHLYASTQRNLQEQRVIKPFTLNPQQQSNVDLLNTASLTIQDFAYTASSPTPPSAGLHPSRYEVHTHAFKFYLEGIANELYDLRVQASQVACIGNATVDEVPLSDSAIADVHGHYFFAAFRRLTLYLQEYGFTDPSQASVFLDDLKRLCNTHLRDVMKANSAIRKTYCGRVYSCLFDPIQAKYLDGDGFRSQKKALHKFYQSVADAREEYLLKCCGGVQKYLHLWSGMEELEARIQMKIELDQSNGVHDVDVPAADLLQAVATLVADTRAIMKEGVMEEELDRQRAQQRLARYTSHVAVHSMASLHHAHAEAIERIESATQAWETLREKKLQKLMRTDVDPGHMSATRKAARNALRRAQVSAESTALENMHRLMMVATPAGSHQALGLTSSTSWSSSDNLQQMLEDDASYYAVVAPPSAAQSVQDTTTSKTSSSKSKIKGLLEKAKRAVLKK